MLPPTTTTNTKHIPFIISHSNYRPVSNNIRNRQFNIIISIINNRMIHF